MSDTSTGLDKTIFSGDVKSIGSSLSFGGSSLSNHVTKYLSPSRSEPDISSVWGLGPLAGNTMQSTRWCRTWTSTASNVRMSPSRNKKTNTKCRKVYNCSLGYKKEKKQIVTAMCLRKRRFRLIYSPFRRHLELKRSSLISLPILFHSLYFPSKLSISNAVLIRPNKAETAPVGSIFLIATDRKPTLIYL